MVLGSCMFCGSHPSPKYYHFVVFKIAPLIYFSFSEAAEPGCWANSLGILKRCGFSPQSHSLPVLSPSQSSSQRFSDLPEGLCLTRAGQLQCHLHSLAEMSHKLRLNENQAQCPSSRFWQKSLFLENRTFPLDPVKTYRLICFLGIHVVYDLSRKPGDRVVKLDVLCTRCRVPSYEPLRTDEEYKVILPSFLVSGGDGYKMLKEEALQHNSGQHKCLFLSMAQRFARTAVLVRRRELLTTRPGPVADSPRCLWECSSTGE